MWCCVRRQRISLVNSHSCHVMNKFMFCFVMLCYKQRTQKPAWKPYLFTSISKVSCVFDLLSNWISRVFLLPPWPVLTIVIANTSHFPTLSSHPGSQFCHEHVHGWCWFAFIGKVHLHEISPCTMNWRTPAALLFIL